MIFAERNASFAGAYTCAQSTDIDNVKDNATSNTALITPAAGSATVDFVPAAAGTYNVFVWHEHTATDTSATLTVERFTNNNFTGLIDTEVTTLVPSYTGANQISKPQARKQRLVMFRLNSTVRALSTASVASVRFTVTGHADPFEVGMIGAYEGFKTKDGHVSGEIRDVTSQAATQARTTATHSGGVSSTQKTVVRDYAYSLKNLSSAEKETLLTIAESVNVSFPFLFVPIPNRYFAGGNYAHPGEEGGIVRLTGPARFDSASALKADATDKYHSQSFGLRRWV